MLWRDNRRDLVYPYTVPMVAGCLALYKNAISNAGFSWYDYDNMPEIARFYGIIVRIFYETTRHQQPHFHAVYGEYLASFTIDPPALLAGTMPRKQLHLILAWAEIYQNELMDNWERASRQLPLQKIPGLS